MKFRISLTLSLLLGLSTAHAIPIQLDFTAGGFGSTPIAPTDPVSGSIVWEADSVFAPIQSLTSIDLTIDGHSYGVAEISFVAGASVSVIGGLVDGVLGAATGNDDFLIAWANATLTPIAFAFASSNTSGFWGAGLGNGEFSSFSITAVPEPGTLALLGLGLLGLVLTRRRTVGA